MTGQIDLNTVASFAAVAGAVGGAWTVTHKLARWKETTDDHLKRQDEHMQAQDGRLDKIEAELRPNHGSSHHDVLVNEIRQAVEDVARTRRHGWF